MRKTAFSAVLSRYAVKVMLLYKYVMWYCFEMLLLEAVMWCCYVMLFCDAVMWWGYEMLLGYMWCGCVMLLCDAPMLSYIRCCHVRYFTTVHCIILHYNYDIAMHYSTLVYIMTSNTWRWWLFDITINSFVSVMRCCYVNVMWRWYIRDLFELCCFR